MASSHTVSQGECMRTIARRHGFSDAMAIWNHPNNEGLRNRRKSPHVLAPGDVVYIPDAKKKVVECATGKSHKFRVRLAKRDVHVVFVDADGQPLANSPYVLRVGNIERKGQTGADGAIHEKGFHPREERAELELTELGITRTLLIGHLNPHHEESGWRQRLANLGYEANESGLADFARDHDFPEDTEAEALRNALHEHSHSPSPR
ncbi:hypothetical protein [Hyalangium versicolor]|uniref:hypothetical protein n=1 Tax=Hyalangium versicolor TaxID=2861190 RepID=UPI001CCD03A6|nr:hypothetical protein [Hyalangium versicolor]